MTENSSPYELTDERKALIEEALKVRAKACESIGPEIINKLYYMLTGRFSEEEKSRKSSKLVG